MKKVFKKSNIFSFLLGTIIFGGIVGVSAYTIFANDIGYTPKDTTWKKSNGEDITNVKDAIDELYMKSNSSVGSSELIGVFSIDVTINGSNIVISVPNSIKKLAKGYIYLLNNDVIKVTTENNFSYSFLELEKNTDYQIIAIAIDQSGKLRSSNPATITTPQLTKVDVNSIGATNGTYSAKDYYSTSWQPLYAFDGNDNTAWGSKDNSIVGNWIQYTFNKPVYLEKIRLLNRTENDYYITSCDIQASNDNFATYETLTSLTGLTRSESKEIEYTSNTPYKSYRLYIKSSSGTVGVGIRAFDIYGYYYQ